MRIHNVLRMSLLVPFVALAFGCASSGDLKALQEQHNQDMQRAMDTANQAKATADEALQAANEARAAANDADNRSKATEEKLNRMFQKSMMK